MLPFPRGRAQHPRGPSAQTALWLPPHCPPSSASLLRIPSFLPEVPPKAFLPLINDVYTNTESFFSFRLCKFRGGAQRSPTEHRVWAQLCCRGSATMPVPVLLHPKVSPGCPQRVPKVPSKCPKGSPKCPQGVPKGSPWCPQRVPKGSSRCPQRVPKVSPKGPHCGHEGPHGVPKVSPGCPQCVPKVAPG